MNRIVLAIVATSAAYGMNYEATAAVLYGTTGQGGSLSDLYTVNTVTGALTPIGPVGYAVSGMDYFDGKLYGVTSAKDPSFHGLIEINTANGAGSPIGTGWVAGTFDKTIAEMAIDSAGNAYGWNENTADDLSSINLATGTTSTVGDSGILTAELGLAFDLSDNLFLINVQGDVFDINLGSGAANLLGNLGVETARHGDIDPDTGIYWGLSDPDESFSDLLSVNLDTFSVLNSVTTAQELHTLAFGPIPEPSSFGLAAIGLAGFIFRRRIHL